MALTRTLKDTLTEMVSVAEGESVIGEGPWVVDGVTLGDPEEDCVSTFFINKQNKKKNNWYMRKVQEKGVGKML